MTTTTKLFGALAVATVLATGAVHADDPEEGPAIGAEAPDFSLASVTDGSMHTLAEHRGKRPVVLVFFRGAW